MCRVTVMSLESLLVRSNRFSVSCCYSVESGISIYTVDQRRISMCRITARRIGLFFSGRNRCYALRCGVTAYNIKFVMVEVPAGNVLGKFSERFSQRNVMTEDQYTYAVIIRVHDYITAEKSMRCDAFSLPIEICVCHCKIYM